MNTIQILLVKNVFLHDDLKEEIYIDIPPRDEHAGNKVCKGIKSLGRLCPSSFMCEHNSFHGNFSWKEVIMSQNGKENFRSCKDKDVVRVVIEK